MKKWTSLIAFSLLAMLLFVGHALGVQFLSTVPGSTDDPLVTKSYVDELLKSYTPQQNTGNITALEQEMTRKMTEYEQKIQTLINNASGQIGGNELIVVQLFPGDILIGVAGTEIIVRSGKTMIVAEENGIPDVTAGKDLGKGTVVPHNHQLLVPRADGRGIVADQASTLPVYVMVRGGYELRKVQ
ncbi:hypothetical protein BHU72_00070 [Desulfuribacillus stibiiarsenatis]|uniref:Uncharacterized protein n=1 Tax=Desulfuribacillus stibiiarsenatis TaxID=1390249 RepID=A0A1E5L9M9_9FIRM|nr:hypothetical protein [Desulfuribacillus stibiiarsenatis]OEH86709.1 hypothetical protein BHU72_00070 [Desulfuribacillus stibiiarsenatis]